MRQPRRSASAWLAIVALALPTALACERFDERPREAAAGFWAALDVRDMEGARRLSTARSESAFRELANGLALEDVTVAEILRNESKALVDTRAQLARRDMELHFNTHLIFVDGAWLVDVDDTERELRRTALAVSFEDVRESIGESAELMVEEFEKRALEASEALREALEGLEESLRDEAPPEIREELPPAT